MDRLAIVALALCFSATLPAAGQLDDVDDATRTKCAQAAKEPLPAEATATRFPKTFPECNSDQLHAGVGSAPDYTSARRCAWQERLATQAGLEPRYTNASVFGGAAMLTVLYANGEGVPRNIPLAMRFACEAAGAPAEIGGRLEDLETRAKATKPADTKFDFCDDMTSGFMMGFCASRSEQRHSFERDARLAKLTPTWSSAQKTSFAEVTKLQAAYAEAHARGELDEAGTARAMFAVDSESSLKDDFVEAITAFEAGRLPQASVQQAQKSDSALNVAYRNSLHDAEAHKSDYGAVQPEGVRKAERAWMAYRDAWLVFAASRYPEISREAWLKLLTDDRIMILNGKSCGALEECDGEERWSPHPLP